MTIPDVIRQQILDAFSGVPQERWSEVLEYLGQMGGAKPTPRAAPPRITAGDLADSELAGIWRDRDDPGERGEFARRLRKASERREWPNRAS